MSEQPPQSVTPKRRLCIIGNNVQVELDDADVAYLIYLLEIEMAPPAAEKMLAHQWKNLCDLHSKLRFVYTMLGELPRGRV